MNEKMPNNVESNPAEQEGDSLEDLLIKQKALEEKLEKATNTNQRKDIINELKGVNKQVEELREAKNTTESAEEEHEAKSEGDDTEKIDKKDDAKNSKDSVERIKKAVDEVDGESVLEESENKRSDSVEEIAKKIKREEEQRAFLEKAERMQAEAKKAGKKDKRMERKEDKQEEKRLMEEFRGADKVATETKAKLRDNEIEPVDRRMPSDEEIENELEKTLANDDEVKKAGEQSGATKTTEQETAPKKSEGPDNATSSSKDIKKGGPDGRYGGVIRDEETGKWKVADPYAKVESTNKTEKPSQEGQNQERQESADSKKEQEQAEKAQEGPKQRAEKQTEQPQRRTQESGPTTAQTQRQEWIPVEPLSMQEIWEDREKRASAFSKWLDSGIDNQIRSFSNTNKIPEDRRRDYYKTLRKDHIEHIKWLKQQAKLAKANGNKALHTQLKTRIKQEEISFREFTKGSLSDGLIKRSWLLNPFRRINWWLKRRRGIIEKDTKRLGDDVERMVAESITNSGKNTESPEPGTSPTPPNPESTPATPESTKQATLDQYTK